MVTRSFLAKELFVIILALAGMFCAFGSADAGTFSAKGKVLDSNGVTPLPGTGLSDMGAADPNQPYGYIQCVYAGPDGTIDPPDIDGSPTGDDVLLETAEYPGQFSTAVGEGYPFLPQGRFFEDFTHVLSVGSMIYCRAWNKTSPSTSTMYVDSPLFALADKEFDENDFGTWSMPGLCECDLNHDGTCNILDWPYFIEDWGSTNCNDPGVDCECDLNGDGSCNILDWPYFIEDWGRTDCPIYP